MVGGLDGDSEGTSLNWTVGLLEGGLVGASVGP